MVPIDWDSEQRKFKGEIVKAMCLLALSLAALLVLVSLRGWADEVGIAQVVGITLLHIAILASLVYSYRADTAMAARLGLCAGGVYNLVVGVVALWVGVAHGATDTGTILVGAWLLAWDFFRRAHALSSHRMRGVLPSPPS